MMVKISPLTRVYAEILFCWIAVHRLCGKTICMHLCVVGCLECAQLLPFEGQFHRRPRMDLLDVSAGCSDCAEEVPSRGFKFGGNEVLRFASKFCPRSSTSSTGVCRSFYFDLFLSCTISGGSSLHLSLRKQMVSSYPDRGFAAFQIRGGLWDLINQTWLYTPPKHQYLPVFRSCGAFALGLCRPLRVRVHL